MLAAWRSSCIVLVLGLACGGDDDSSDSAGPSTITNANTSASSVSTANEPTTSNDSASGDGEGSSSTAEPPTGGDVTCQGHADCPAGSFCLGDPPCNPGTCMPLPAECTEGPDCECVLASGLLMCVGDGACTPANDCIGCTYPP